MLDAQQEGEGIIVGGESLRPPLTGIGRYTSFLLRALVEGFRLTRLRVFDGWRAIEWAQIRVKTSSTKGSLYSMRRALRAVPGLYPLRQSLRDARFRYLAANAKLYHEPNYILKPFDGICVTTIHDLSHVVHPEFHPRERVRWLDRHLPRSLDRASRIIAVSAFTRDELVHHFAIPPERITITPLAPAPHFRPLDEGEAKPILARYGLRWKGYVFSLATLEPRKNFIGLLEAYGKLPAALRKAYPLVCAGAVGWLANDTLSRFNRLLTRQEMFWNGYIADTDLPALLSGCRCFVYVPFYEGFGLPVLEAQSCGAVSVTSNCSALPEIAADTCLLVDPRDIDAISENIRRALEDEEVALAAMDIGPRFASRYTWQHTAEATLQVYRSVMD